MLSLHHYKWTLVNMGDHRLSEQLKLLLEHLGKRNPVFEALMGMKSAEGSQLRYGRKDNLRCLLKFLGIDVPRVRVWNFSSKLSFFLELLLRFYE